MPQATDEQPKGHTTGKALSGFRIAKAQDPEAIERVAEFDGEVRVVSLEEKPAKPKSNYAVPGIYFYDAKAADLAARRGLAGAYFENDVSGDLITDQRDGPLAFDWTAPDGLEGPFRAQWTGSPTQVAKRSFPSIPGQGLQL